MNVFIDHEATINYPKENIIAANEDFDIVAFGSTVHAIDHDSGIILKSQIHVTDPLALAEKWLKIF